VRRYLAGAAPARPAARRPGRRGRGASLTARSAPADPGGLSSLSLPMAPRPSSSSPSRTASRWSRERATATPVRLAPPVVAVSGGEALASASPGSRVDVLVSTEPRTGAGSTFVARAWSCSAWAASRRADRWTQAPAARGRRPRPPRSRRCERRCPGRLPHCGPELRTRGQAPAASAGRPEQKRPLRRLGGRPLRATSGRPESARGLSFRAAARIFWRTGLRTVFMSVPAAATRGGSSSRRRTPRPRTPRAWTDRRCISRPRSSPCSNRSPPSPRESS